ncbi:MAG TPA: hypothetical protein GX396_02725, partial [Tissierellia bacterium]|nr:hypothetical protein [Tissierellia bacterium]
MIDKINPVNSINLPQKKITDPKEKDLNIEPNRKKYDSIEINKLIADNEKRINDFKDLIRKMIVKQGEKHNLTLFGQKLYVTEEDS